MKAVEFIALLQAATGLVVLVGTVSKSLRLRSRVPEDVRRRWSVMTSLQGFFVLGYLAFLAALVFNLKLPLEVITGTIFLAGALFVYLVTEVSGAAVNGLVEQERVREDLIRRLESHTHSLIEANEELEGEIATQKKLEKELKSKDEHYRALIQSTSDSIYVIDREFRYVYMNRQHMERLALAADEVIGKAYGDFHSRDEVEYFEDKVNRVFSTGESLQAEHRSNRDGNHFLQTFSPVRDEDDKVTGCTVISKDITGRKNMEDELRRFSFTDDLTSLTNRRGFFALAEHQLKRAQRFNERLFLLYIDLDNLKVINDSLGHQEGDIALEETANILKKTFRDSDIVARIGGDEFVVGPASLDGNEVSASIDRLEAALVHHNAGEARPYALSFSIGQTFFDPKHPCSIDDLLARADRSMYANKQRKPALTLKKA